LYPLFPTRRSSDLLFIADNVCSPQLSKNTILSMKYILFILSLLAVIPATGQNKDTVPDFVSLSSVTVTGYETNHKLLETAGSIGLLTRDEMQRGDNRDIMSALNTIPGVKMEAYSTGNYRISIRGSLLNNPWGIRNVKIYWNDIPLSSPDGTAQKSIDFDPTLIGTVEVLKGPSGSIYGAGNGGVLLLKSTKGEREDTAIETGYTFGSYGYGRFHGLYKTSGDKFNIAANVVSPSYARYSEIN